MNSSLGEQNKKSILFIPHGGGPLPLLNHEPHRELSDFLKNSSNAIIKPKTIIVITAHWEADPVRVSSSDSPTMLFDYLEAVYHGQLMNSYISGYGA